MGRSSRRYLQPQTPRRAALGPAELPKFGPASACRAAAPSPAVPGRAKPSPAVPSRSGVPRAPPAAQRPETEGTGGRKAGRKERRKGLPRRDLGEGDSRSTGCGRWLPCRWELQGAVQNGTEKPPRPPPGSALSPKCTVPRLTFTGGFGVLDHILSRRREFPAAGCPCHPAKPCSGQAAVQEGPGLQ